MPAFVCIVSCLAALLASAAPALACSPAVRGEIVRRATKLMPPALARQCARYERDLVAGALEGLPAPGTPVRALEPGETDAQLAAALADATRLVNEHAPLRAVVHAFGRVARHATDLSFALHVGPHDPRADGVYGRFCRYVEEKLPRIKTTFPGYVDPDLARRDPLAFARRVAADARRDYDGILRSYFPDGRAPRAQDFDDRSVAFGSAALEVSLALTTVARGWLYAWNEAGGDLTGTPFLYDGPQAAQRTRP